MDVELLGQVIKNPLRRDLIKLLLKKELTASEAFEEVKELGVEVKYRQTVYRALEDLVELGIAKKSYNQDSGLVYSVEAQKIVIYLEEMRAHKVENSDER